MTKAPPNLTAKLGSLADKVEYKALGSPVIRWGQILRTPPSASALIEGAAAAGRLVTLKSLANAHSGVVTRANPYFVVQDLAFEQIPNRFRVTKRDYRTVAVILDGRDTPHRVAREHLRRIVKGPESLHGPLEVADTNLRVFSVEQSPDDLRAAKDNDTLLYLRRGETVDYNVSADKKKGGIPAQRSNIRVRKPFWYSLNLPTPTPGRLVIPEHFDQRFITSAITDENIDRVVIDTCYVAELNEPDQQMAVLAAMNSLLSWYQIELRGRTQHGEGVLKVKLPDFDGVLLLDPASLSAEETDRLLAAFEPIAHRRTLIVSEELQLDDRVEFDRVYLELLGLDPEAAEETRSLLARELREAMAERRTRTESVADQKAQKTPKRQASRAVDAFAARIVSGLGPYPDPRTFVGASALQTPVEVKPFEGSLTLGQGLFDAGVVFAGSEPIAETAGAAQARFVRAVLTIDPQQTVADIPTDDVLNAAMTQWDAAVAQWWDEFVPVRDAVVKQITDERMVASVTLRALSIAHAAEIPPSAAVPEFAPAVRSSVRPSRRRRMAAKKT